MRSEASLSPKDVKGCMMFVVLNKCFPYFKLQVEQQNFYSTLEEQRRHPRASYSIPKLLATLHGFVMSVYIKQM